MISMETATGIALAYREIATAEKLLADVRDAVARFAHKDIRDAFGRIQHGLQLGVPSGENGHRLFNVPYGLAVPVIEANIAHQRASLSALMVKAQAELAAPAAAYEPGTFVQLDEGQSA